MTIHEDRVYFKRDGDIGNAAHELITKNWKKGIPIPTLTITGENLVTADQAEV